MGPSSRNLNVPETLTHPSNIRKYVVLLHDCIAVKFQALVQHCPSTSLLSSEELGHNSVNSISGKKSGKKTGADEQTYGSSKKFSLYGSNSNNSSGGCNNGSDKLPASSSSNQGVSLFQEFREVNLKCYWNAAIVETFNHLEYRGFILPSTLFISSHRKFLHILRTAWARQMLKSPQGFRIEFIGDTEEILCEPIQQSHFSPLSDSLCWTILDMTSRGEEAFVETICLALGQSFPGMVKPSCELVYQTLEKLIRERKVYQTARGYFVVTPDTFRYMTAARMREGASSFSTHSLALDALLSCHYQQQDDRLSYSRHSWDSAASADLFTPSSNMSGNNNKASAAAAANSSSNSNNNKGTAKSLRNLAGLKRHNSLKLFRRKDNPELLGAKSLSFRLSKSKPFMFDVNHDDTLIKSSDNNMKHSALGVAATDGSGSNKSEKNLQKKGKGIFSKLFSFRRSNRSKRKQAEEEEEEEQQQQQEKLRNQTSESVSGEYSSQRNNNASSHAMLDDTESGCFTLDRENHHYDFAGTPKWNSLPKRSYRTNSRRSIFGMVDDNNALYATPGASTVSTEPIIPDRSSASSSSFVRAQSSRSSTLSHGTSLGYGSQGPNSFLTSQSPCPSVSANSTYATISNNGNHHHAHHNGSSSGGVVGCSNHPDVNNKGATVKDNNYKSYYELYRRRYPSSRIYGRRSSSPMLTSSPFITNSHKPVYETIDNAKRKEETHHHPNIVTTASAVVQNVKSSSSKKTEVTTMLPKSPQEACYSKALNNHHNHHHHSNNNNNNGKQEQDNNRSINVVFGDGSTNTVVKSMSSSSSGSTTGTVTTSGMGDTQVKTIVNANGQIETHFDCRHGGVKSTIEIKASNNRKSNDSEDCHCADTSTIITNNNNNHSNNAATTTAAGPEVKKELLINGTTTTTATADVQSKINLATKLFSNVNFATKLLSSSE